ncbi:putative leucine-rich repeat-containing protein DDB_G0290503 [Physella acuta]|uniref:putative leucine-rich repeat-containing protein DDB_G0290503 n=1 Tax=Physella acuta TaxID=109671 RepID=UPI0027DDDDA6|nr:putative leucine-rich repeat-containing protein DDB_G0290503 [Physella acuta]XP_059166863.1 putative leucine-rich repeat-containing protein DDB_G0290503 [Physella acuta]
MSEHSKRQLKNLIEQLEECCVFLQSGFSDFVEQVKRRTSDCLQNNMAFKEAIAVASTAHSTLLEHMDMLTESKKMYPRQEMTKEKMTTEMLYAKSTQGEKVTEGTNSDLLSRLEHIETAFAALQDIKQKTEDNIEELKQWRDNSVTKHNDLEINIEKLSKKQKLNFKNMKKQLNDQDKKIMEINKVIENLKQRQSSTAERQEKMSLDIKEHETDFEKLNQNVQDLTDSFTQQIKEHSDLIYDLQEKEKNIEHKFDNLISKQAVMCKVLQQRLSPIDKFLQMFN